MDMLEKSDWDEMAFRLSKYIKVFEGDSVQDVKLKLRKELSKDERGKNLLKPYAWKQLWREIVPRLMDIDFVKGKLYKRSGGKLTSYERDKMRTAQRVVTDFETFERKSPSKVDMDGIDTKNAEFVKNKRK